MTTGQELTTFITGLNGGATIDETLLSVLVQNAQAIVEEERPWMVLRKTNSGLTASTSDTWQTSKALAATITDFSRFYSDEPICLFDSASNRREYYRQVPFEKRLEYKDVSGTFVYDANAGVIYLNGLVPFNGTLYINYIVTSTAVDPTSASAVWTLFPSRFLPILGYYAIGIFKGAVDYDSINRQMLPTNAAILQSLKNALNSWDNERALAATENIDPTDDYGGTWRSGAINRHDS